MDTKQAIIMETEDERGYYQHQSDSHEGVAILARRTRIMVSHK